MKSFPKLTSLVVHFFPVSELWGKVVKV